MKVLFINTVYGRGSTGRIVADLGHMLEEKGHEYRVAYGRGDNSSDLHCYRIGNDWNMYIHAGLSRVTDRAGFYSRKATKKLVEYIEEYNPDIIHLHNLHGYYLNIEVLFDYLADKYKGRVIWTLHDCWAFTGHCTHYTYAGCEKWKTGCEHCPQKGEYPSSYICDNSKKNYSDKKRLFTGVQNLEIITVSNWLKGEVEESYLKSLNKKCIYNGIDIDRFRYVSNSVKEELEIGDKKMILLVSDGWTIQKGYSTVLEVAKVAPENWQFVIVGLTKKQIKKLPKNITGVEHIWNQDKLIEFYSAADVFFNPSREETFGLVTGEALACGTPVLVIKSTACHEIVGENVCGKILEENSSIITYVESINELMTNRNKSFPLTKDLFLDNYMHLYCKGLLYDRNNL